MTREDLEKLEDDFDIENCCYCGKFVDRSKYTIGELLCSTLFSFPGNYVCHKECLIKRETPIP